MYIIIKRIFIIKLVITDYMGIAWFRCSYIMLHTLYMMETCEIIVSMVHKLSKLPLFNIP